MNSFLIFFTFFIGWLIGSAGQRMYWIDFINNANEEDEFYEEEDN